MERRPQILNSVNVCEDVRLFVHWLPIPINLSLRRYAVIQARRFLPRVICNTRVTGLALHHKNLIAHVQSSRVNPMDPLHWITE